MASNSHEPDPWKKYRRNFPTETETSRFSRTVETGETGFPRNGEKAQSVVSAETLRNRNQPFLKKPQNRFKKRGQPDPSMRSRHP